MRIPRIRLTIGRSMVVVAILGLAMGTGAWLWRRSVRFRAEAAHHARKEAECKAAAFGFARQARFRKEELNRRREEQASDDSPFARKKRELQAVAGAGGRRVNPEPDANLDRLLKGADWQRASEEYHAMLKNRYHRAVITGPFPVRGSRSRTTRPRPGEAGSPWPKPDQAETRPASTSCPNPVAARFSRTSA